MAVMTASNSRVASCIKLSTSPTWRISSVSVSSSGAKVRLFDTDVLASSSSALRSLIAWLESINSSRVSDTFQRKYEEKKLPMSNHLRSGRGPKRCPTGSGAGKPIWRRCARTRRRQFGRKTGIFDDRIDRPMSPRVISVFFFQVSPRFFQGKIRYQFCLQYLSKNKIRAREPLWITPHSAQPDAAQL